MKTIARKDAKALKQGTYFTGKPCVNGHVSYRYVGSGACNQCINGVTTPKPTIDEATRQGYIHAHETVNGFVMFTASIMQEDVETAKAIVLGYAMSHSPFITEGHIWLTLKPRLGVLYKMLVDVKDVDAIRNVLLVMFRSRNPHLTTERERILGLASSSVITADHKDLYAIK